MTREADLTKAIARTAIAIAYARERAMEHNHPEWRDDVLALLVLADEYRTVHTPEYQIDMVADHYDLVATKARKIPFADNEEMAPDGPAAALFGAVGQLIGAADGVIRAAAALGKLPTSAAQPLPNKIEIDRSTYRRQLDALLSHVRETRDMVKTYVEPEATAPDQGPLEQKIIGNYVNEMQLTDKSIHVTISIGDGIDLAVLERFVSRLATATREMAESVKSWPGAAANRVRIGVEAVRKPVRRAVGSIGGLILKLVRKEEKSPPAAPPPLPDDFLDQAQAMILAGDAPPAHWAPHIDELDFDNRKLAEIEPLAKLNALKRLYLKNTLVSDITPLAKLYALQHLNLRDTKVRDITALAKLVALKNLDLWNTQVSDIALLVNLSTLQSLSVTGTQICDIGPIANLAALERLDLMNTQVSDITPLTNLAALQSLYLMNTQVSDIAPLANLAALQSLSLRNTKASDIAPLANLHALKNLDIRRTKVSDISPLSNLSALEKLDLRDTQISDISPLSRILSLIVRVESDERASALRATLTQGSTVEVNIQG